MKFSQYKNRAFTLLECLIALFIMSGSVLVIQGLTKLIHQDLIQMQDSREKDWQSFCHQLRSELDDSIFVSADGKFLYVKKKKDWRFGVVSDADDFRKSNANGRGYQPMLHGVDSSFISEDNGLVTIKITFQKGGEYIFLYKFSNTLDEEE